MSDILCPVCNADLGLTGDEEEGDVVVCSCCASPILFKAVGNNGDPVLIEDF